MVYSLNGILYNMGMNNVSLYATARINLRNNVEQNEPVTKMHTA